MRPGEMLKRLGPLKIVRRIQLGNQRAGGNPKRIETSPAWASTRRQRCGRIGLRAAEAAWKAEKQPLPLRVELVFKRRQHGSVENHRKSLRKPETEER